MSHDHDHHDHHGHDHAHDHGDHGHSHGAKHVHAPASFGKAFAIGVALNTGFVIIEVAYGFLALQLRFHMSAPCFGLMGSSP
jgi:cobalt-zinc-cadmium efflux system protein